MRSLGLCVYLSALWLRISTHGREVRDPRKVTICTSLIAYYGSRNLGTDSRYGLCHSSAGYFSYRLFSISFGKFVLPTIERFFCQHRGCLTVSFAAHRPESFSTMSTPLLGNKGPHVNAVIYAFFVLATMAVILRFYGRYVTHEPGF